MSEDNPYAEPQLSYEQWESIRQLLLEGLRDQVSAYEYYTFLKIASYPPRYVEHV